MTRHLQLSQQREGGNFLEAATFPAIYLKTVKISYFFLQLLIMGVKKCLLRVHLLNPFKLQLQLCVALRNVIMQ